MQTIREMLNLRPTKGDLGVEIEVEGRNLPRNPQSYWRVEHDGSLRGDENAEYVLRKPLSSGGLHAALNYLGDEYEDHNTTVDDSVRAGVHVHVNVQELNMVQVYNMIVAYLILEEVLVKFCGEHREGNLFCLRAVDAEYLPLKLADIARRQRWQHLHSDELRYGSINVKALHQYGSLEFRAMRGTRNLSVIEGWANVLLNLRKVATSYACPKDIVYSMSGEGAEYFMDRCLGEHSPLFKEMCPDYEAMIKRGVRQAQDVAFATDWDRLLAKDVDKGIEVKKPMFAPGDWAINGPKAGLIIEDEF